MTPLEALVTPLEALGVDFSHVLVYRRQMLILHLWMLVALGVVFFLAAFDASGQCLVLPCVTGKASNMFRVHTGLSFQTLMVGCLYIATPVTGLRFLRFPCDVFTAGGYVSAMGFVSVLALCTAIVWNSEADIFEKTGHLEIKGEEVVLNKSLRSTFSVLHTTSVFYFIFSLSCSVVLMLTKDCYSDCEPEGVVIEEEEEDGGGYSAPSSGGRKLYNNVSYQGVSLVDDAEVATPEAHSTRTSAAQARREPVGSTGPEMAPNPTDHRSSSQQPRGHSGSTRPGVPQQGQRHSTPAGAGAGDSPSTSLTLGGNKSTTSRFPPVQGGPSKNAADYIEDDEDAEEASI